MSGGHFRHVPPVGSRRHDPSTARRHNLRQNDPLQESFADSALLEARRDLPPGRRPVSDVPRRGHAQEPHHRSQHPGPAASAAGDPRGRIDAPVPDGAGTDRGRMRVGPVLHLATNGGAPDYGGLAAVEHGRDGFDPGTVRDRGHPRGHHRVHWAEHPGPVQLPGE
uniref:(northern house mosquito) hypothetical protein n=1 Tax=Culex pipiens TaxID=7175 RepID=A0A8D8B323_CULPI